MTLADLLAQVPDDYLWLLRSDESGRYFANLCPKGEVSGGTFKMVNGRLQLSMDTPSKPYFPNYGATPEAALEGSLSAYRAAQTKH